MNVAAHSIRDTRTTRIGIASMLLGALLVTAGLIQTTTSHFNESCPSGTTLVAEFDNVHNHYNFDKPSGNQNVVTLTNTSDSGGNWTSTLAVSAVIVRGGDGAVTTSIAPPQHSGTFSNAGLPKSGFPKKTADIDSVQFCGPTVQPSTSTSSSTTTSTQPVTSTTKKCPCTSTTTTPTTSTTLPTTTTSEGATTTTSTSTTTTSTTTTSTTTTTTTPTTEPRETTTSSSTSTTATTIPEETTTSSTQVAGSTLVGGSTSTTVHGAGSTTSLPYVTSTTVFTPDEGTELPFTGGQSGPLIVLGILFLATGFALTLSATRRHRGSRA